MRIRIKLPKWWGEREDRKRKQLLGRADKILNKRLESNWFNSFPSIDIYRIIQVFVSFLHGFIFFYLTRNMFEEAGKTLSSANMSGTLVATIEQSSGNVFNIFSFIGGVFIFYFTYRIFNRTSNSWGEMQ